MAADRLSQLLDRIAAALSPAPTTVQKSRNAAKPLYDFRTSKQTHQQRSAVTAIMDLQRTLWELSPAVRSNPHQAALLIDALSLSYQFAEADPTALPELLAQLRKVAEKLPPLPAAAPVSFSLPALPEEIRAEVQADVEELQKCFAAGAYRSCTVLCGRILETALHRRYYEVTGHDILEKSPGIGLGNLIAKMKEKGISLDPALANQIHLINQVRIFSVHKKQEAFSPNKTQAQAIMLYTMDTVGKLFRK